MTAASNEVIQADRELAADIWRKYVARTGEMIVERGFREGRMDEGLPSMIAAHRIAHSDPRPVAEGLREALSNCVNVLCSLRKNYERDNLLWNEASRFITEGNAALATHSPAPMAGEAIRAVTSEMRRFMPNSCGDWADKIDTALSGPAQPLTIAESAELTGYIHGKDYRDNSVEAVAHRQARFVELNKRYLAAHPSTQEGNA